MSRTSNKSSENRIKSPVKYYLRYGAEKGMFNYWDGEKAVDVDGLEFVLMDEKKCITGWSDRLKARINSNRVNSTAKEPLTVRCGNEVLVEGLYNEIKEKIAVAGGKFTNQLFVLAKIDGEFVPCSLELSGAGNGSWIEFLDNSGGKFSLYRQMIVAQMGPEEKKGRSTFHRIDFSTTVLTPELDAQANEFNDDCLQPYLTQGTNTPEVVA